MDFLNSGLSQYILQTVLHSLIIVIVVETMLSLWHIQKPSLQIKFRLLGLLLPVLCFPLYFLLYPPRASISFEPVALFNSKEWLRLRLGEDITVWHLFFALLALTTTYFLIREAIPSLRHYLGHRHSFPTIEPGKFAKLDSVLANLAKDLPMPTVLLSTEDTPVVYTMGRRALVISATTINTLDSEELEAVISHELAHLSRQAYRLNQIALILRFLMFYNPLALLTFHRIINDNEKNCDDIAVRATGKPLALASGLLRVFRQTMASLALAGSNRSWLPLRVGVLEHQAYSNLIRERVERLVHPSNGDVPNENFRLLLTAGLLVVVLFFVV